jgi:hypothetical protein
MRALIAALRGTSIILPIGTSFNGFTRRQTCGACRITGPNRNPILGTAIAATAAALRAILSPLRKFRRSFVMLETVREIAKRFVITL